MTTANAGVEAPVRLRPRVVAVHPHDPDAYTQGLLWYDGRVYESTGRYGRSVVRIWRLEDGTVEYQQRLDDDLFGEGLALVDDRLIQLTWQAGEALLWSPSELEPRGRLAYEGEGWGLAWTGSQLFQSDGTHLLRLRDPETFAEIGRLEVRREGLRVDGLNELEWAEGRLWANLYQRDEIVRIDPATGNVDAVVDASGLLDAEEARGVDVLNGIAYRPETKTFLLTGKLWPRVFEVELVESVAE